MGGIYAREAGEPEAVWKAIYHHYLPIGGRSRRRAPTAGALGAARVTWARCRSPTSSTRSSGCSWRASGRPDRAIRSACAGRRTASCAFCSTPRRSTGAARSARRSAQLLAQARARAIDASDARRGVLDGPATTFLASACSSCFEQRGARSAQRARGARSRATAADRVGRPTCEREPARRCRSSPSRSRSGSSRRRSSACATSRASSTARIRRARAAALRAQRPEGTGRESRCSTSSTSAARRSSAAVATGARLPRRLSSKPSSFEPAVARFFNEVFVMTDDRDAAAGAAAADETTRAADSTARRYFRNRRTGVLTLMATRNAKKSGKSGKTAKSQQARLFLRQAARPTAIARCAICSAARAPGLAEMTNAGLPVPPGFTISTDASARSTTRTRASCRRRSSRRCWRISRSSRRRPARSSGRPTNPLLVSVRSGAKFSMPGMMDTILNLGLNDVDRRGPQGADDERPVRVRQLPPLHPDVRQRRARDSEGRLRARARGRQEGARASSRTPTSTRRRCATWSTRYKKVVQKQDRSKDFPQDPLEQLRGARDAVFRSWQNPRAKEYRRIYDIPDHIGTAVNVQAMVFGNTGDRSGTGVGFTRNPATGAKEFYGEFLINAQGEDVVAGIRTPQPIAELEKVMPKAYKQLRDDHDAAREALQGRPGLRVHDPGRQAVHAADAQRQAHRLRRGRDRDRPGRPRS